MLIIYGAKILIFIKKKMKLRSFDIIITVLIRKFKVVRINEGLLDVFLWPQYFYFAVPYHARSQKKNILTKMQMTIGPLGLLYKYMEEKIRVKVSIFCRKKNISKLSNYILNFKISLYQFSINFKLYFLNNLQKIKLLQSSFFFSYIFWIKSQCLFADFSWFNMYKQHHVIFPQRLPSACPLLTKRTVC